MTSYTWIAGIIACLRFWIAAAEAEPPTVVAVVEPIASGGSSAVVPESDDYSAALPLLNLFPRIVAVDLLASTCYLTHSDD